MLAYFVMKARMEAAIAGERSALAEARARLEGQAKTLAETIRATEEAAKRQAFDEFLADLRVENATICASRRRCSSARRALFTGAHFLPQYPAFELGRTRNAD